MHNRVALKKQNYAPYIVAEGCLFIAFLLFVTQVVYPIITQPYKGVFILISTLSFFGAIGLSYIFLKTWNSKKADAWMRVSILVIILIAVIPSLIVHTAFVSTASFFIAIGGLLGTFVSKVIMVYRNSRTSKESIL